MLLREQQAILRSQDGDLTGLGVLFELHQQAVFRTAYGIVGNHHMAEEITQQTFVELFTAIKRFDHKRSFMPWLYRIVVNVSLKELRRGRHHSISLEQEVDDLPSFEPMPDQTAEESEVRRSLWEAIRNLSPKHSAAVVLRYYHGLSEAEMAVALRCRRGTVKSRLHSARRQLEKLLR